MIALICTFLITETLNIYFLSYYHSLENCLVIPFPLSGERLRCFPYRTTRNVSVVSLCIWVDSLLKASDGGGLCMPMPLSQWWANYLAFIPAGKRSVGDRRGPVETSSMILPRR